MEVVKRHKKYKQQEQSEQKDQDTDRYWILPTEILHMGEKV